MHQYFDLAQKNMIFCTKYAISGGKTERLVWEGWNFCHLQIKIFAKKRDQNSIFLSEAIHGEIIIYLKRVTWAIQNFWVHMFDLTFNSSPNHSQNTIESYYGYDCSWLKWPNIQWKWKWSNIFFKYLSSEIMELEKNEGQGIHFGILSYWHFAMGIPHSALCLKLAMSYLPPLSKDEKVRRLCAFSAAVRLWLNHTFLLWNWCNMIFTKDADLTKPFEDLSKK